MQGSVVATYLHGPCLARNPELADHLLSKVVGPLPPLELPEVEQLRRERLAAPRRVVASFAQIELTQTKLRGGPLRQWLTRTPTKGV